MVKYTKDKMTVFAYAEDDYISVAKDGIHFGQARVQPWEDEKEITKEEFLKFAGDHYADSLCVAIEAWIDRREEQEEAEFTVAHVNMQIREDGDFFVERGRGERDGGGTFWQFDLIHQQEIVDRLAANIKKHS